MGFFLKLEINYLEYRILVIVLHIFHISKGKKKCKTKTIQQNVCSAFKKVNKTNKQALECISPNVGKSND